MAAPLRLEVFEQPGDPEVASLLMPEELEDLRLNAYERGYLAGWEDAMREVQTEAQAREKALAKQLEAISFSYHDARGHVLRAVGPLLQAMAEQVLPQAARAALVPQVLEEIAPFAEEVSCAPMVLQVPQGAAPAFEAGLRDRSIPPVEIVETPDLPEGAAEFRIGPRQVRVDLTDLSARFAKAIDDFYSHALPQKEPGNVSNG